MGLDLHVMPLSRFLSGRYTSPLEDVMGDKVKRMGSSKPSNSPEECRRILEAIRGVLQKVARGPVDWNEGADQVYKTQYDYEAFVRLGDFAAHQDHPKTSGFFRKTPVAFDEFGDPGSHPGRMKILEGAPSAYRHLIVHHDNQGFYFPADFEEPFQLMEGIIAGSSHRLLAELDRLQKILGMTRDWGQLAAGETASKEGEPLPKVRYGWSVLHCCARLSVQHRLPIIFDG